MQANCVMRGSVLPLPKKVVGARVSRPNRRVTVHSSCTSFDFKPVTGFPPSIMCPAVSGFEHLRSRHLSIKNQKSRPSALVVTCGMKKDDFYIRHESGRMNKTAGKKVMQDIRKLARRLVELPEYRLPAVFPLLEPGMVRSIEICRKMNTRNHGRNREENYLSKQLLHMDAEERARIFEAVDPSLGPSTSGGKKKKAGAAAPLLAPEASSNPYDDDEEGAGFDREGDEDGFVDTDGEDTEQEGEEGEAEAVPARRVEGDRVVVTAAMPAGQMFLQAIDAGPEIERLAIEWKGALIAGDKEVQSMILGLENLSDLTGGLDRQQLRQLIQNAKKEDAEHKKLRSKQAAEAAAWVRSLDENDEDPAALQVLPGYADLIAEAKGQPQDAEANAKRLTKHNRELLRVLKGVSAQAILEAYQSMGAKAPRI